MNYFKRIYIKYDNEGIGRVLSYFLRKLGINIKYHSYLVNKKLKIYEKIAKITKHKVTHGIYKSLKLSKEYNWQKNNIDLSSKLLGCYEEQVQEKIIEITKKNNLKYLVVFGAGEGFHALGLLKNNFFSKGYVFEKDDHTRHILTKNAKINLIKNIKIFAEANFSAIPIFLNRKIQNKTLFLIDIEGEEFNILNKKNLPYFKNSYLIIENHENFVKNIKLKEIFFKFINKNFKFYYLNNGSRDPFKFKNLNHLNDDSRWLAMSECRPCNMNWLILSPK